MTTPCSSTDTDVQQKTALVVTSGSDVDELVMDVLVNDGWSIHRAVDNQHALALAVTEPFELIITGRKPSGPEDVELLRKIRGARPHLRLISRTEQWTPGEVIAARREGAFS